jgi:ketosteroid isomerase-like protein
MAVSSQVGAMNFDAFKQAINQSDAAALAAMYDDNAVIEIFNQNAPPKHPKRFRGKSEIEAFYVDVCGRALKHHIQDEVAMGDHAAFLERCTYPDGMDVVSATTMTIRDGRITHQSTVEAWDQ